MKAFGIKKTAKSRESEIIIINTSTCIGFLSAWKDGRGYSVDRACDSW